MKRLMAGRAAGIAVLVVVAALAAVMLVMRSWSVHPDGSGLLASANRQMHEAMSVDPKGSGVGSWTFGMRLCLSGAGGPAVLRQVGPGETVGTGFRELGTGIRVFTPTPSHEPIISVSAYPPPAAQMPDALAKVDGYAVTTPCSNTPRQEYTELLVGLGMAGDDGGGWKGVKISYEAGGHTFTVLIDHDLLICGRSDPLC